jgi:adenylate cyclase
VGDVQIGVGINSGDACVGNMGSMSRFNYSVVGDTVNVAARIESSCKVVGWPVLVSEDTAEAIEDFALLEAGAIALKGKSRPAKLYAVIGDETLAQTADWQTMRQRHEAFLEALAAGKQDEVEPLKQACLAVAPPGLDQFYSELAAAGASRLAAE